MLTEAAAKALAERVITRARAIKGAEALVAISSDHGGNTRFARGEITTSGDVDRTSVTVTVQFGLRSASATTNQLDDHAIEDVVARAVRIARLAPENPEAMAVLGKQTYQPVPHASDPATAKATPQVRAKAVGAALATARGKAVLAGFYEHAVTATAIATSAGLWAFHEATWCGLSCTARTSDGSGSGWAGTSSNKLADLDAGALAAIAVGKATRSATPKRLDPGRYTVILEPSAVASLMWFFTGNLGARRADEGRSFFAKPGGGTRIGDKLFPDTITLHSDPADATTRGMPFDGDGLPLAATKWIDRGTLTGLEYGRYWAKKMNAKPTGQPSGWTLDGGTAKVEDLIKGVKRGVLVTRFWYLRDVDPQALLATGLTRDGTFLIENGELAHPVNNFRFNESPIQMLARCDGLASASVAAGEGEGMRAPTLRTHEFNLASISDAV